MKTTIEIPDHPLVDGLQKEMENRNKELKEKTLEFQKLLANNPRSGLVSGLQREIEELMEVIEYLKVLTENFEEVATDEIKEIDKQLRDKIIAKYSS